MSDLRKLDRTETVKVGEPYTFLGSEYTEATGVDERMVDWWATDEPGRLFLITAVHQNALETIYLGFCAFPGSFQTQEEIAHG
jgi:hypothetical protein